MNQRTIFRERCAGVDVGIEKGDACAHAAGEVNRLGNRLAGEMRTIGGNKNMAVHR
ncbi:hypothetical protein SDC9_211225 [bioreactor metagenome]|uniref:Uncharacterized protein n=1 Tax=bioreactor metagenome TaxID=1076179 RepID=A0A645JJ60_9ZZZZ